MAFASLFKFIYLSPVIFAHTYCNSMWPNSPKAALHSTFYCLSYAPKKQNEPEIWEGFWRF